MMHIRVGDPYPTVSSVTWDSPRICNCACQRCLEGGCCQLPDPDPAPVTPWITRTTSTTVLSPSIGCGALDHDYAVFDPARLYCRKCGDIKAVR